MKKNESGAVFIAALLALMLIVFAAIIFGGKYVFSESYPTLQYNNFEFKQKAGFWHTLWQRDGELFEIALRFNPEDVADVPVVGVLNNSFNALRNIYISFDPLADASQFKYLALGASEMTLNLAGPLGKEVTAACTRNETEACVSRPIVGCDDRDKNVIVLRAESAPRIELNNTCMTFYGAEFELIKSIDKAIYLWMNIVQRPQSSPR